MGKQMKKVAMAVVGAIGAPVLAHATPVTTFDLPELPMDQLYTYGGVILGGLAVIWVFRKLVKTSNRS